MISMSGVRKHFWIEVARAQGAGSSPTKYGLNGTMPAMVKRTEGSCGMRLAEGTTLWPLLGEVAREGRPQSVGVHRTSLPVRKTAPGRRRRPKRPRAQADDIPTMGLLRWMLPVDPKNGESP